VVALGVARAGPGELFASGFRNTPGKFELTVYLTRLLFRTSSSCRSRRPESYLNPRRFQLAAATPVALNLSIVLAAYALAPLSVPVPVALCIGVIAGGLAQLLMQAPLAKKLGFVFGGSPAGDPEVARTALQIAPRLYGYGIGQINFLISSRTLSRLGDAFITYNFNAFRVVDLVRAASWSDDEGAPALASEQALDEDKTAFEKSILPA
jgi:putative peptidoglycan lipid II flippase